MTWFEGAGSKSDGQIAVVLPFDLDSVLDDWQALRVKMARTLPPGFTRNEWAYLISFLETENLLGAFVQAFGRRAPSNGSSRRTQAIARPGGPVAVWLPNNVSLLGPLTLILLSLTGNDLLLKGGSKSEDLTGAFLQFASQNLRPGPLLDHLSDRVRYDVFDRDDARNAEYSQVAASRIIFGSDAAGAAIDALPHPLGSTTSAFVDRRSEAWISPALIDDDLVITLVKIFAIYGQAGCTSPRRVVLIRDEGSVDVEAGERLAHSVRDRAHDLWMQAAPGVAPPHVASNSIMTRQLAAARGWDAILVPNHAAVLASGSAELELIDGAMLLPIVSMSLDAAAAALPENIQTIGHAVADPGSDRWLRMVGRLRAKRFVPLARMHHFGPVWDGTEFWRNSFERVEIGT